MRPLFPIQCNLCDAREAELLYIKDKVHIVKCKGCGLVFNLEMKKPRDLAGIYCESYFLGGDIGFGYDDYLAQRDNHLRTFRKRFKIVDKYKKQGKLLSVGCGFGFCVHLARQRHWQATGVEISEFACQWAKNNLGLEMHNSTLADAHFPDNHFDVVLMWGYIQESLDPLGEIKEVYRILKPGGMLFIQTQNADSLYAKMSGEKWLQFKPQTTSYYFSKKTARLLLHKAGFAICEINPWSAGQYCSLAFLLNRLSYAWPGLKRINALISKNKLLQKTSLYVNLFDLLHISAKKRPSEDG